MTTIMLMAESVKNESRSSLLVCLLSLCISTTHYSSTCKPDGHQRLSFNVPSTRHCYYTSECANNAAHVAAACTCIPAVKVSMKQIPQQVVKLTNIFKTKLHVSLSKSLSWQDKENNKAQLSDNMCRKKHRALMHYSHVASQSLVTDVLADRMPF